jgi:hypothetical protein
MQSLANVNLPANWNAAIKTGHEAFDELCGNCGGVFGARQGKTILFSAQSGTGKTRLCLAIGNAMTKFDPDINYGHFTGEQSVTALAIMGKMMGIDFNDNMKAESINYWPSIERHVIESNITVVVLDSFPMLQFPADPNTKKAPDTKQKCEMIAKFADKYNLSIIILNHTDKKGNRAGRNELLHLVDVAYTMHKSDAKKYEGVKVIEFMCDKNREGSPVNRAFPFNGTWDLDTPYELEESTGNETGEANEGKVATRKATQKENLIQNMRDCGGVLHRADLEDETFVVDGMRSSGITALLRAMVDSQEVLAHKDEDHQGRGQPATTHWTLV